MYDMAETRSRSIRVTDEVWAALQALPGKTDEALRAILIKGKPTDNHTEVNRWFRETWSRLDEIRELMESVASLGVSEPQENPAARAAAAAKAAREQSSDPAEIPGVHRGLPPRESANERAARERREREERALALDKTGGDRDDVDRSDEYVSS